MAGVTVGNIEIQISSNAQNAISSLSKLSNATNTSSSSMKNLESNVKNISRATQKMSGSFNNVTSIIATSLGFGSLNQAINSFIRLANESTRNAISLIENYNLFTVSMKGASTTQEEYNANLAQGIDFQNQLNSAFGTAIMDSMRYQGFFRNLANSLGLSNDASMTLSENLTKLTYDLSSLYNTDFATMYSKLQSGLVGQTKPLRSIGVDVTQQTLQPTLYSLGINKKVTELTQAQKVMLRYIEILRQTTSAQGDMARTIETPANQLRILKDQWKELTMWLGTLFIGVLGKVLPYLNGIVMAFKNVFKYMSDIFGFKLSDYQFATVSEDAGLIDDALSEAVDTSNELKKSLAGFDELNVLSPNATSTYSLTEDLSVTTALQNAMSGYDNLMSSVKTKASQISEEFLKWFGYTLDANGNITGISGGLAQIAKIAFDKVNEFFANIKIFVNDVASWLKENPEWAEWLINTGVQLGLLAAGVWLFYNPFWAIVTAIGVFITYYDDIKNMWTAMTPSEKVITGILAAAAAVAAFWIASTAGTASIGIVAGLAAAGIVGALSMVAFSNDNNTKGSSFASSAVNSNIPTYQGNWTTRASGGYVNTGEMFIAREAGAELVGSIGGKTAVMNNDQIVSSVAQGVANAVSSVMGGSNGQTVNVYLDDVLVGNAIINSINRATKNTGNTVMVG